MFSSSEDSADSDSGTNFKRGKKKRRSESPRDDRKASRSSFDVRALPSQGKKQESRRSVERHQAKHSRDAKHKTSESSKPSKVEEVKKKRSRSSEKNFHKKDHRHAASTSHAKEHQKKDLREVLKEESKKREVQEASSKYRQRSRSRTSDERKHRKETADFHQPPAHRSPQSANEAKKQSHSRQSSYESYGPALPPTHRPTNHHKIGPALPKDFVPSSAVYEAPSDGYYNVISDDDDDNVIGPMPTSAEHLSERDLEREKRKIELKLQLLDQRQQALNPDVKHREEWMLELPEIRKIPDMGLSSRQFRKNDRPDFSDRTSWTKTPNDVHKPHNHREEKKNDDEDRKRDLIRRRDEQQEKMAKEHKKAHKRDKSLLEIHEKKLRKEKVTNRSRSWRCKHFNIFFFILQKKQKEEKKPERRPFNRDSDLSANTFDEARKKSALKKAQLLDMRFSSGNKKYL